jgi:beta-glucanase (GH16 family)
LWPAFWLLPASLDSTPEIDVLEIIGDEPDVLRMHFHYIDEMGNDPAPGSNWHGPDFSADWHIYAVDWRTDQIIWFVDGVERWRFTDQRYIPDMEMYLLLNLAVGGDWPGPPTSETVFPNYFDIDYVRVWQSID